MRHILHSLIVLVTLCAANTFGVQAQGIRFETGSFEEALKKAASENKLLFMDCYTTWCGPCKILSNKVFPNDTVGTFFNKHFVNLKMDMEKGEGTALGKTYQIKAYPTLLFIDPSSRKVVYRTTGARPDIRWLLGEARKAIDPKSNLQGAAEAYRQNKQDARAALHYLSVLNSASMTQERDRVLNEYLLHVSEADRYSETNWQILESQISEPYSASFEYLLKYAPGFRQSVGEERVDKKIDLVYRYAVMPFIRRKRVPAEQFPEAKFKQLVSLLQKENNEKYAYYMAQLNMVESVQRGDYKGMLDSLEKAEKSQVLTTDTYFYFVWLNLTYLWECTDAAIIDRGLVWAEKLKPAETDLSTRKAWLGMKAKLYKAKGDTAMEARLKEEAENIKN